MAYINKAEPEFRRLGEPSIREKYMALLVDVENCKHEFSDPVYDPEEIVFFDTKRDRWYVDCKICGTRKYTYAKEKYMKLSR